MTYQVLARKWRPQDFAALVGQEPIVTALRNALREGRIAQAYLFSGIRGVGKTTAARLFAKALNCERGPAEEPCNECATCREITAGSDLDVIEIDAATHSKVEQVRELTESLRYGPARDRYKVVVIDEIHRLSRQAFDALLKIVEEPPSHLTFIFATTEIETVPATILSRCQEYHFRRVPAQVLSAHLRAIAGAESITASDRALRLIARAGEGSVRDSVALLDQLATFGQGEISDDDAVRLLGGLDVALYLRLLAAILDTRPDEVVAIVREIEDNGWDPRQAFAQFLAYCRDALHLALGGDEAQVDLPPDDIEPLRERAKEAGYENLLRLLNQLLASELIVRRSEASSLALEIAWLRAAELPKLVRLEELLGGTEPAGGEPQARRSPATTSDRSVRARGSQPSRSSSAAVADSASDSSEIDSQELDSGSQAPGVEATGVPNQLAAFLDLVRKERPALRAHLQGALQLAFKKGALRITGNRDDHLLRDALDRHRTLLDRAVTAVWGEEARWLLRPASGEPAAGSGDRPTSPAGPPAQRGEAAAESTAAESIAAESKPAESKPADSKAAESGRARPAGKSGAAADSSSPQRPRGDDAAERRRAADHPSVQAVLDVFGGSVESVRPREEDRGESAGDP